MKCSCFRNKLVPFLYTLTVAEHILDSSVALLLLTEASEQLLCESEGIAA